MIGTPQGDRRVQDSNAYEVHMPNAGLAVVPLVADKVAASGSDNPDVSMLENKAAIHKLHKLGHWLSHLVIVGKNQPSFDLRFTDLSRRIAECRL